MVDMVVKAKPFRMLPKLDMIPATGSVLFYNPDAPAGERLAQLEISNLVKFIRGLLAEEVAKLPTPQPGPKGDKGDKGDKGATGPGLPAGGTAGQVLRKKSATTNDVEWKSPLLGIFTS